MFNPSKKLSRMFTQKQLIMLKDMYNMYIIQSTYYTTLLLSIQKMLYHNNISCSYKMCQKVLNLLKKDYQSW